MLFVIGGQARPCRVYKCHVAGKNVYKCHPAMWRENNLTANFIIVNLVKSDVS